MLVVDNYLLITVCSFKVLYFIYYVYSLSVSQGLLVFAETAGLPISMYFNEPGRWDAYHINHSLFRFVLKWLYSSFVRVCISPVVLSVSDSVLEANFVLATLSEDQSNHNNNKADG